MVDSNNARLDKIYVSGSKHYIVAGIFTVPSVEMLCLDDGSMTSFGDGALNGQSFVETDDHVTERVRRDAYDKRERRFKHGTMAMEKKAAPVLHMVTGDEISAGRVAPARQEPENEYIAKIRTEVERLLEATDTNSLRGIAVSYIIADEERKHLTGMHTFITDGRGLINLNSGLDLLKQYMVDSMREAFGQK